MKKISYKFKVDTLLGHADCLNSEDGKIFDYGFALLYADKRAGELKKVKVDSWFYNLLWKFFYNSYVREPRVWS